MKLLQNLLAWYQKLPNELRIVFLVVGIGAPSTIVYLLSDLIGGLFDVEPRNRRTVGALVIIGAIVGLIVLGFLVTRFFGYFKGRRERKMTRQLADSGTSGPVAMDARDRIRENNDKFQGNVKQMKKEFGVNVYDLPWYITIGDSGCGKTRLIEKGSLTFSAGKPEGTGLGTLDYNFFFSEEAVVVDMAGRLTNPKEDKDYREWKGFLETIAKGRPGYPINGAIVCVSAEHLLEDPQQKHEEDANIALERLRELQARLGVTFATYFVVTKCDKIVGFMELFDQARRDVQTRHQLVGWSRPGDYDEVYQPDHFGDDFNELYNQLNDLRLKRLHETADEDDDLAKAVAGAAYTFPEEFRELYSPLTTYVRTLFPYVKNPRAMKNLVFRGIYFTSATQEGALLTKHLRERIGEDAATNFAQLEMTYPDTKPFFIRDYFFDKMLPEQGLVFRNVDDVKRNVKLGRWLLVASVAIAAVVISLVAMGTNSLAHMADTPTKDIRKASVKSIYGSVETATKHADVLDKDAEDLKKTDFFAWLVAMMNFDSSGPANNVQIVRSALIERGIVANLIGSAQSALKNHQISPPESANGSGESPPAPLLSGLEAYLSWWGCSAVSKNGVDGEAATKRYDVVARLADEETLKLSSEQIGTILTAYWDTHFDKLAPNDYPEHADEKLEHRRAAYPGHRTPDLVIKPVFATENPDWDESARKWGAYRKEVEKTVDSALGQISTYYLSIAGLKGGQLDGHFKGWLELPEICEQVEQDYDAILKLRDRGVESRKELETLQSDFQTPLARLVKYRDFIWEAEAIRDSSGFERIPTLDGLILSYREQWTAPLERLEDALNSCIKSTDDAEPSASGLLEEDENLRKAILNKISGCKQSLDEAYWKSLQDKGVIPNDLPVNFDKKYLKDYFELRGGGNPCPHVFDVSLGKPGERDSIQPTQSFKDVVSILKKLHEDVGSQMTMREQNPGEWVFSLELLSKRLTDSKPESIDQIKNESAWRPDQLGELAKTCARLGVRGDITSALGTLAEQLSRCQEGQNEVGIAAMWNDFSECKPNDRFQMCANQPGNGLEMWAHRDRLRTIVQDSAALKERLDSISENDYFPSAEGSLHRKCGELIRPTVVKYLDHYFRSWRDLATVPKVTSANANNWSDYTSKMADNETGARMGGWLREVLKHVAFAEDRSEPTAMPFASEIDVARSTTWQDSMAMFVEARRIGDTPDTAGKLLKTWNTFESDIARVNLNAANVGELKWPQSMEFKVFPTHVSQELMASVIYGREIADKEIDRQLRKGAGNARGCPFAGETGTPGREDFEKFISNSLAIKKQFELFDNGLAGSEARREFYAACEDWNDYLSSSVRLGFGKPNLDGPGTKNGHNRIVLVFGGKKYCWNPNTLELLGPPSDSNLGNSIIGCGRCDDLDSITRIANMPDLEAEEKVIDARVKITDPLEVACWFESGRGSISTEMMVRGKRLTIDIPVKFDGRRPPSKKIRRR